jgi:type I restriction enzyme S subunit
MPDLRLADLIADGALELNDGYRTKQAELGQPGVPILRVAEVLDGRIAPTFRDYIRKEFRPQFGRKVSRKGDIVLTTKGTVGRVAMIPCDSPEFVYSPQVCFFRVGAGGRVVCRWLYYWLQGDEFRSQALSIQGQTDMAPYINLVDLRAVRIRVSSVKEQQGIADVLSALDDKIEGNRQTIDRLSSLVASTWHQRFGVEDHPESLDIPISQLAQVLGGSTPRTNEPEFWDGDIAWATPKDLSRLSSVPLVDTERRVTHRGLEQISSGLLPIGTVLLSSRAPIGYLAIAEIPVAVNQGFIALIPGQRVSSLFLWQWLAHHLDDVKARANGTTFLEVSKANFRPMPVALPSEDEMRHWSDGAEPMYRLIVSKEQETSVLTKLRDSLLPALLSGALRVNAAETIDEEEK